MTQMARLDECHIDCVVFAEKSEAGQDYSLLLHARTMPLRSISVNKHGSHGCVFAPPQKRAGTTAATYAAYCTQAASRNPRLAGTHCARVKPQHE